MYGQLRFAALEIVDPQALLRNKLAAAPGAGQTALLLLEQAVHHMQEITGWPHNWGDYHWQSVVSSTAAEER